MSQIATSLALRSWAMWVPTYVPRPPVPMMPNETAELAWAPNAVEDFNIVSAPVARVSASRLLIPDMNVSFKVRLYHRSRVSKQAG